MCTVSFISNDDSLIITSNRDEHIDRPNSYQPKERVINGVRVIFPKDPKAGGTWFAVNENGMVAVLLNGAFKRQKRKENYAKSRGLVVLDVISQPDPEDALKELDLNNIESFTLVINQGDKLLEFRWDEKKKHYSKLDFDKNHIWSSVTLYDEAAITKREKLFDRFVKTTDTLTNDKIMDFHLNNQGDHENGFVINRDNGLKTFSVTQAIVNTSKVTLKHLDLVNNGKYTITIDNGHLMESVQ